MSATIKIRLEGLTVGERDILMARLSEAGFDAFEERPEGLDAYISEDRFSTGMVEEVLEGRDFGQERLEEQNWNARWESEFQPVKVGRFCTVRALFHPPAHDTRFDIIITPKMSFGTGHHATTFLMISEMEEMEWEGKRVLDFGTGTGILAILAEKLGAAAITAIDNDSWSIANAGENLNLNLCSRVDLYQADNVSVTFQPDIILANINRHVLLAALPSLRQHLAPGGVLLLSGLLSGDREVMEMALKGAGLAITEQKERGGWILLKVVQDNV